MPLLRFASDAVEAVRDFFGDRRDARDRKALMAKRRFKVASSWDELGEHETTAAKVDAIRRSGRIEEFEPLFRTMHAEDLSLPSGCALHEMLLERLYLKAPSDAESQARYVAPFRAAFERAPTPLTAGLLAKALIRCSNESRGAGTVDETSDAQWEAYAVHRAQARAALDACLDAAGDCPVWRRAQYFLALDEAPSREAFGEAFERAWALDRHNLDLCANHGILLLPRWLGESAHDLEVFARRAVALTEKRFGASAYAFIHSVQAGVGHHEASDTLCDPDLLKRGFDDLIARFPGQSVLNRYAMSMDWIGDVAAVYRIQKHIHTITPDIWGWGYDDEDEEGLREALDAFLIARDARVSERLDREETA